MLLCMVINVGACVARPGDIGVLSWRFGLDVNADEVRDGGSRSQIRNPEIVVPKMKTDKFVTMRLCAENFNQCKISKVSD